MTRKSTDLKVLFEDNHLIAINKQPSELVQGDKTGDTCLADKIKEYLKDKYNKPGKVFLGVIHRLDRPSSGVVVFARTGKALARMNELFREKNIKKTYWAVVRNAPEAPSGSLVHYLSKNQKQNKSYTAAHEKAGYKQAILNYKMLASSDHYHLLEVDLETGRHHQIRAQLAAIGCPVKGDIKYGDRRTNKDASIHLHAREIAFIHPVSKEEICITAPPPGEALWNAFAELI